MPPKRKVLAEADANKDATARPAKKATRAATAKQSLATKETAKAAGSKVTPELEGKFKATSTVQKSTAPKEKARPTSGAKKPVEPKEITNTGTKSKKSAEPNVVKARKSKYSDAETVPERLKLDFVNVAWPSPDSDDSENEDDESQEDEGDPKPGDMLTEEMIKRVSKMGYPISNDGIKMFQWMVNEQDKRDQDRHDMYIYNDFSGYGTTEMIENLLAGFNKVLFKKDVSPFKKWAHIEALATWLKIADLMPWMSNDDYDGMCDIINMFGTMLLTSFDMLSEHGLLAADSSLPNIGILSLIMIEFIHDTAGDFEVDWAHEVVRALDKAGVEIKARKEVRVSHERLEELREQFKKKESEEVEDGKNIYKVHFANKSWGPDGDCEDGERLWARWDWKKEYAKFKHNHAGGNKYNLEKWSKREKAEYTFGTEDYERKIAEMMG